MMSLFKKIKNSEKIKISNLKKAIEIARNDDAVLLKWSSSEETWNNFGDALNPWLFNKITGKSPENANKIINFSNKIVYSSIGSILDNNNSENLIVWGSGFKKNNSVFKEIPLEIRAVRGPLSRNNILKQGLECPEIYGDPALLLPKFYKANVDKVYKLGIIAHYIDKENMNYKSLISKLNDDVLLIDIQNPIEQVINEINMCEKIASSSLHGIIVADAYGIPSIQLKFSDNIVGGDFKFKDYMLSVNREYRPPVNVNLETTLNTILNSFYDYNFHINLEKLLEVCPFV